MLTDYLKDYDKYIIKRLFPNKTIDFGERFDDEGYSVIFLTKDDETPTAPSEYIYICYHKITEEQRMKLISNKPSYVTIEEFDPPIYKRYISKVYKVTYNPSLEQRIERCKKTIAELENSTDENEKILLEDFRKHLQKLLELQETLTV